MSKFDLPELPSDEELGITSKDRDEGSSSYADLLSLLSDEYGTGKKAGESGGGPKGGAPTPRPRRSGPAVPPPGGSWRGPVTLLLLAFMGWGFSTRRSIPSPQPVNAPDSVFSSGRAMADLVEIARRPHAPGSPEHARVRESLLDDLRELGVDPTVQTTTSTIRRGGWVRSATVRNIVARIPGEASTGAVLVTAHYDSRELSRGAGDDGVGVVSILEALRTVRTGPPLKNDVIVLITDAEELGLLGARAFVAEHPAMADVRVALSVEMRGGGGPSVMFETGEDNGWIVGALKAADPLPQANSIMFDVYERMPNDTDFTPFREAGVQGLNFAGVDRASVYHQAYDIPENVSEGTLQHHGMHLVGMLRYLGQADLTQVDGPNSVYFTVPVLGLVVYPGSWVLAVSGVVLVLAGLIGWLALRGGMRPAGILAGIVTTLVSGGAAWAMGRYLVRWLAGFHAEVGALHAGMFHHEGTYVIALIAMVLTVTVVLFTLARRWFAPGALAFGAAVLVSLTALVLGFVLPMGAMNVQWPAIFLLGGTALSLGVAPNRRPGTGVWLALMLLLSGAMAFMVPLVETFWLSMGLGMAPWLGVLVVFATLFLIPALDSLGEPNGWWLPAVGVVVAGIAIVLGINRAEAGPSNPAPSTLIYTLDRGEAQAFWATQADQEGRLDKEAFDWAQDQTGTVFEVARSLDAFLSRPAPDYVVSAADVLPVRAPVVALASDSVTEGGRMVDLAFRSAAGAEMFMVRFPGENPPELVAVNGHPLPPVADAGNGGDGDMTLEYWGTPDSVATLTMKVGAGSEVVTVDLVEHILRPSEVVGPDVFRRPASLAPDIRRLSDRVMVRTPVQVDLRTGAVTLRGVEEPSEGAVGEETEASPGAVPDTSAAAPDTAAAPAGR